MLRYTEMFFLVLFELYLMRAHLEWLYSFVEDLRQLRVNLLGIQSKFLIQSIYPFLIY
jgi:hypothetical protein